MMGIRIAIGCVALVLVAGNLKAADASPQVMLNVTKAAPRTVEPLTQRAVLRDYKFAWTNLAQALESNSTESLNGLFAGNANTALK